MDYTGFINNGIDSLKHLWYERIVILCGSYNELFILNLKSATIIQYTIKGRFMSR